MLDSEQVVVCCYLENTPQMVNTCSRSTVEAEEQCLWTFSKIFIVDFEPIITH